MDFQLHQGEDSDMKLRALRDTKLSNVPFPNEQLVEHRTSVVPEGTVLSVRMFLRHFVGSMGGLVLDPGIPSDEDKLKRVKSPTLYQFWYYESKDFELVKQTKPTN